MASLVETVVGGYADNEVAWKKVVTKHLEGAMRYQELAFAAKGPVPVPSIYINGELAFDQTPGEDELKDRIDAILKGGELPE